jgi:tellurium resistance protein TerZ
MCGCKLGSHCKKGFFSNKTEAVDLDASCAVYDENKNKIDVVSFRQLKSNDQAIRHSGDDLTGDLNGNDGLDNEVITVDFSRLNPSASYVAFFINSFRGQDFKDIPFASIRIYEGTPTRVNEVFAKYDMQTMLPLQEAFLYFSVCFTSVTASGNLMP